MKLIVTNKATMPAELIIVAQENLQKLVDETKCPNSKALLDRKVFNTDPTKTNDEIIPTSETTQSYYIRIVLRIITFTSCPSTG